MDKIFVDSDILLDFLLDRIPFSESATQLIDLAYNKKVELYTSPLIIANVVYVSRKNLGIQIVKQVIEKLLQIIEILPITESEIKQALASDFNDFEDAIQNFCASQKNDIQYLITRNKKDFKHSQLQVISPSEYLLI